MTESEAITRCLQRDAQAFGWVVRQHKHMIHTVSLRVLRHREDAEESTQDTFVKAFQNFSAFQGGSKLSTWLYSIAYRTAVSKLRGRKNREVVAEEHSRAAIGAVDLDRNEAADRSRALDMALSALPEEDATVITLFYLHEQSIEEIVTITGLTAWNVKVKLHRSRKRMHTTLELLLKDELWTIMEP